MTFLDRAFCCKSDQCDKDCYRRLTDDLKEKAKEWWGMDDYPVAYGDFSDECERWIKEEE